MVPTLILAGDIDLIVPVSKIKSVYGDIKGIRIVVSLRNVDNKNIKNKKTN